MNLAYFVAAITCGGFAAMFWSYLAVNLWVGKRIGDQSDPRRLNTAVLWAVTMTMVTCFFVALALRAAQTP